MNRNVQLGLLQAYLVEVPRYLLSRGIFAAYILLLWDDNSKVGLATGVGGMVQLAAAFPAGACADRLGRQQVLRAAAAFFVPAGVFTLLCVLYLRTHTGLHIFFIALLASQCLWGLHLGVQSPALEAIFADSVESGGRSFLYQARTGCRFFGQACGPALAALVFLCRGDSWTVTELTIIQVGAVGFSVLVALCLCLFADVHCLGSTSESLVPGDPPDSAGAALRQGTCRDIRYVAPLIAASDSLSMLGSGMTVQVCQSSASTCSSPFSYTAH